MNDYELKLKQLDVNGVWRRRGPRGYLCDRALREHVSLPRDCRDIVLIFSNKRTPEATRFTPDRVCDTNNALLYHAFVWLLDHQYAAGRRYIRVEY